MSDKWIARNFWLVCWQSNVRLDMNLIFFNNKCIVFVSKSTSETWNIWYVFVDLWFFWSDETRRFNKRIEIRIEIVFFVFWQKVSIVDCNFELDCDFVKLSNNVVENTSFKNLFRRKIWKLCWRDFENTNLKFDWRSKVDDYDDVDNIFDFVWQFIDVVVMTFDEIVDVECNENDVFENNKERIDDWRRQSVCECLFDSRKNVLLKAFAID